MLAIRKTPELTLRALSLTSQRRFCKDYDSDDEKHKSKKSKAKESAIEATTPPAATGESAAERLNRLLASMPTQASLSSNLAKQVNETIARPGETNKKRKEAAKKEKESKDIVTAAKRVAELLDADTKVQTESELLSKLLGHNTQQGTNVEALKGAPKGNESEMSLSDLIVGMKIDRKQRPREQSRAEYVRGALARTQRPSFSSSRPTTQRTDRKRAAESYTGSVNLFGSNPLGIFKEPQKLRESPDILTTWAELYEREMKLLVTHPPANYFEKIALWTEKGRVWRFPIDNEQDWLDEVDVDFSEHIFLEQHLEPWCPNKGPVRHFMELVCVGLSKNPYITAQEKKEHILWYRDYFQNKKDILRGLMDSDKMDQINADDANKVKSLN